MMKKSKRLLKDSQSQQINSLKVKKPKKALDKVLSVQEKRINHDEQMAFLQQAGRKSFMNFCEIVKEGYNAEWFHEFIGNILEKSLHQIARGEKVRIILTIPPRHGKTELASVLFPAWALGTYPDMPFILSSYGAELSETNGLKTRDVINSDQYKFIFPDIKLRSDQKAKAKWMTNKGGSYTAVGIGTSVTGKGAKCVLIDDPHKDRQEAESKVVRDTVWEYYRSTLYSRLEGFGGVIVIMQRWHCLSSEQCVNIEGKMIKIKNVKEGDLILTSQGYQPIKHVQKNQLGDKKILRLLFSGSGQAIEVTDDHLIKTEEGWKKAGDFKVGDNAILKCDVKKNEVHEKRLERKANKMTGHFRGTQTSIQAEKLLQYVSEGKTTTEMAKLLGYKSRNTIGQHLAMLGISADFKNSLNNGYALDEDFWWILGRWMADGSRSSGRKIDQKNRITITVGGKKEKDIERITRFLSKHNIRHSKEEGLSVFNVRFSCKQFADYTRDIGGNAHDKKIPAYVFDLPIYLKVAFIEGYASGDAYSTLDSIRYSSVSYDLVSGLQNLLLTLNRHSNIYYQKVKIRSDSKIKSCGYTYELKEFESDRTLKITSNNVRVKQLKSIEVVEDYNDDVYDVTVDAGEINIGGITVHNCDDLVGRLMEEMERGRASGQAFDEWQVINFPAIADDDEYYEGKLLRKAGEPLWKSKFPIPVLENIKQTSGLYNWVSQYQQDPILQEAQDFKPHMFRYYEDNELEGKYLRYYTLVDPAISQNTSADNTVVLTVAKEVNGPNIYRIREDAGHYTPDQTIQLIFDHQTTYRSEVAIETVQYQQALKYAVIEEQRKRGQYFTVHELRSRTNKEERIKGLVALYAAGVIFHRHSDMEYERELLAFPRGRRDDRADAMAFFPMLGVNTFSGSVKIYKPKWMSYGKKK